MPFEVFIKINEIGNTQWFKILVFDLIVKTIYD